MVVLVTQVATGDPDKCDYFERFQSEMAAQKQRLLEQKALIEFIHEEDEVNRCINQLRILSAFKD